MEIHDDKHETDFLKNYDPDNRTGASVTRLGRPPVRCQECHADNIVGQLQGKPQPGEKKAIKSLTEAIHLLHLEKTADPDENGRTSNCQGCHPAHQQSGSLAEFPLTKNGEFRGGDIREYRGGCFLGRDLHSNPEAGNILGTAKHLNAIGKWMKKNVMTEGKGLYCTNWRGIYHSRGHRLDSCQKK